MLESLPITNTLFFEALAGFAAAIGAAIGGIVWLRLKFRAQQILPQSPSSNDWNVKCEDDRFSLTCHPACVLKISVSEGTVSLDIKNATPPNPPLNPQLLLTPVTHAGQLQSDPEYSESSI
jgi:hypothetical protein